MSNSTNSHSPIKTVDEVIKCGRDANYFIKNYVYIQHPTRGPIPFKTYGYQDECVEQFKEHRLNIVVKSRQLGLTTVVAAYCLWLAMFYKSKNILVVATKLATAQLFIDKVKFAHKSLPSWMTSLTKVSSETKTQLKFTNGSVLKAVPTSEDVGRGEAVSVIVIDECAFIKDFDVIYTAIQPTISTGGRAIFISSPAAAAGQFYDLWCGAQTKDNDYNPIELKWDVIPERDEKWLRETKRSMSERQFLQEYCCSFSSSGDTFFEGDSLQWLEVERKEPLEKQGEDRNFWIWKYPEPSHKYIISADVSRGNSEDYSAACVIDVNTFEMVAEYKGKLPPDRFGEKLCLFGRTYNNALLCPENNSYGETALMRIKQLGYQNLYYERGKEVISFGGYYVPHNEKEQAGYATTGKTRMPLLNKLEESVRNQRLKIYSSRFINEAKTFIWNNQRPEAAKGKNDDLIMAAAIGVHIAGYAGEYGEKMKSVTNQMAKTFEFVNTPAPKPNINGYVNSSSQFGGPLIHEDSPLKPKQETLDSANLTPTEMAKKYGWLF